MKKFNTVILVLALTASLAGCAREENEKSNEYSDNISEHTDSKTTAQKLSDGFAEYWNSLSDHVMIGPKADLFETDKFEDFDRTVFFVYPEYKTCHAVIFGVNGGDVRQIGDIQCGFDFALSSADGGMFRTEKTIAGSHSSEIFNTYYRVSSEGIEEELNISTLMVEGSVSGYNIYVDGECSDITSEEYNSKKLDADTDFNNADLISLDSDADFHMDGGFKLIDSTSDSFDSAEFTEYIIKKLTE